MMQVTRWESSDGKLFLSAEQAAKHERLCAEIVKAKAIIGPKPDGHGTFVQLTHGQVLQYIEALRHLIYEVHEEKWGDMFTKDPRGIIGRYLSDGGSMLYGLWITLDCIDGEEKLWDQPFFAYNGERA